MDLELPDLTLALLVNLETLRDVLATLSIDGKRCWIATDTEDAAARGHLTIGHGYPGCHDRLNTLFFQTPVFSTEASKVRADKLMVLIDFPNWLAQDPGFVERGRLILGSVEDLLSSFNPIRDALIARLQARHNQGER